LAMSLLTIEIATGVSLSNEKIPTRLSQILISKEKGYFLESIFLVSRSSFLLVGLILLVSGQITRLNILFLMRR